MRPFTYIPLVTLLSSAVLGQATRPAFQIADVHASAYVRNPNVFGPIASPLVSNPNLQGGVLQGGRYELRRATMLDLIKTAYEVDGDTVTGGPGWLELDRFDVIAKAPANAPPATVKLMLQALLADRFQLAVHKDTRPMAGFVLALGRGKPKMKPADGSGDTGCQEQRRPTGLGEGVPPRLVACRNMTMEALAPALRGLDGGYLTGPVLNQTGLMGAWDFDLTWNQKRPVLAGDDGITIFDAVDKQLGLKLEPQKVPMPVLVLDHVNEKPTANSPEVTRLLPPLPQPEFEVASIRPSLPGVLLEGAGFQPGGRVEWRGIPLALLILQAWDLNINPDEIPGAPKWLKLIEPAFDLVAKAPAATIASGTQLYSEDLQLMLRGLLVDRFKMKVHYEDRPLDAYTLIAAKPKLKMADPSTRTGCKVERLTAPRDLADGPPPFVATCQNITMAQFADQLQTIASSYFRYPVQNASGIDGAWDLRFTFNQLRPKQLGGGGGGGRGGAPGGPQPSVLSDPSGGVSLFDALEKQLGLKLEKRQRPEPVFVIDHIEEKPTEN
jgi:uncharacterized protein (TIGR03435 family)